MKLSLDRKFIQYLLNDGAFGECDSVSGERKVATLIGLSDGYISLRTPDNGIVGLRWEDDFLQVMGILPDFEDARVVARADLIAWIGDLLEEPSMGEDLELVDFGISPDGIWIEVNAK